ncbi:hypothetical protein GCK72_013476 [Caenorhabditis remanei]|uniref:Uncharacterized protein n=1 Tax=Caenorhabditis remanei TaxID=31234 RepID=A0A6A5GQS1_CAERE|nr:hypothetical protein GCK72_013476 [Caenorhabditis remanei]KAF1757021.1 hypothetical protein GCK72_013476 [Caenorhabditis remanei]
MRISVLFVAISLCCYVTTVQSGESEASVSSAHASNALEASVHESIPARSLQPAIPWEQICKAAMTKDYSGKIEEIECLVRSILPLMLLETSDLLLDHERL